MATGTQVSDWQDYQANDGWQDYQSSAAKPAAEPKPGLLDRADTAIQSFLAPNPQNYESLGRTNAIEVPKTLGREVYSGVQTILGMPAGLYHAVTDQPTLNESAMYGNDPGKRIAGRVLGITPAVEAAVDYADPKTRPTVDQALSVLPEALGQGVGAVVAGKALEAGAPRVLNAAQPVIAPVVRSTGKLIEAATTPDIAGRAVGGAAGGIIGRASNIPHAGLFGAGVGEEIGGAVGRRLGTEPLIKTPGMQVFGYGEPVPGLRAVPEGPAVPEFLRENPAVSSPSRTLPGMNSPEIIAPPRQVPTPIPPRSGLMLPGEVIDTSPKAVGNVINESLGGWEGPRSGVRIADQFSPEAAPVAVQPLPKDFTPVKSSLLDGYKYNPQTQEFDASIKGQTYRTGDVSPDQVAQFESAKSKGSAYNQFIKNGPGSVGMGKVDAEGNLIPRIKDRSLQSASPLEMTMQEGFKADPFSKASIDAENRWYQQAKDELGPGAGISKISQRAQELKMASRRPPVSDDLTDILTESLRRTKKARK